MGGPESRPVEGEASNQGQNTGLGGDLYRRIQAQDPPQQGNGQWRQTYGGDVGQTTGQQRQGNGKDPYYRGPRQDGRWRNDPFNRGGDSFKPGGQGQQGDGQQQPPQQQQRPPVEDPNRNGNQSTGPEYKPKTPYTFNDKQPDNGMGPGTGKGQPRPGGAGKGGPLDQIIAQKERAVAGLKHHTNSMGTNAVAGFAFGALAEPFTYTTSRIAEKGVSLSAPAEGAATTAQSRAGGLAQWWQTNYDPRKFFSADLEKQVSKFDQFHAKVTDIIKTEGTQLDDLAKLEEAGTITAEQRGTMTKLMDRHKWLNATEWGDAATGAKRLESLKNLAKTEFTAAEIELLENRQLALATKADLAAKAKAAQEVKFMTGSGMWANAKSGALNVIAATALKSVDGGVSKMLNTEEGSLTSLTVPLALGYGKQMGLSRTKTGLYALGGIAAAHAIDALAPDSLWRRNTTETTAVEAGLMGLAFAVPTKDVKARALLIGGAWGAGRLYNLARGESLGDKAEDALKSLEDDKKDRSYGTLNDSTNQFKKIARGETFWLQGDKIGLYKNDGNTNRTGEPVIQAQIAEEINKMKTGWQTMSSADKLQGFRDIAILATAMGENRLDKGTRILRENKPTYALEGYGLDLGGDSLMYLKMAKEQGVDKAKQMTQKLIADNPDGDYKSSEIADLDKFGRRIDASIDKIYSKHDIDGAFKELIKFVPGNENTFGKTFLDNTNNKIAANRTGDPKMLAKLFRDLSMSYMALASNKMERGKDGGGAFDLMFGTDQGRQAAFGNTGKARGYDGAMDCLMAAEKLDPNNPDLPQLKEIAQRLGQQARDKAQAQLSDPTTNPLNVNDGLYKK